MQSSSLSSCANRSLKQDAMKKIILSAILGIASLLSYGQTNQKWGTTLNAVSGSDALGTSNNFPLVIKTNNTARLKIEAGGKILFNNVAGYSADYSSSFTSLSLVHKTYVDNSVLNAGIKLLQAGSTVFWRKSGNSGTTPGIDFIGTSDAQDLVFKTAGEEHMRITSSGDHPGNVGIGTDDPEKKLHVVTTHTICANCPQTHEGIRVEEQTTYLGPTPPNATNPTINAWDLQPYGGNAFAIRKPGQNPAMTIFNNGNVAIGVLTGPARLEVKGSGTTNATSALNVTNQNGVSHLRVKDDGKVLIGTPGALGSAGKLQVVETAQNQPAIVGGDTSANSIWLVPNLGGGGYNPLSKNGDVGIIFRKGNQNSAGAGLVIAPHSASSVGMRIAHDGKVSIGILESLMTTNSGNYQLYVAGGIMTERCRVALKSSADWGDWVFDKRNKRMNFEEQLLYYTKHKHLKWIPSAAALKSDGGIDISEMLTGVVINLEEARLDNITLYKENLEQKKEMEEIKTQIKEIQVQISALTKTK
jgi:hypothetical protein